MRLRLLAPFFRTLRNRFFPAGAFPLKTLSVILFGLLVCLAFYFVTQKVVSYFHRQNELGVILSLKIFEMGWIVMFAMLIFSCMVSAVSTLFLSQDNEIIFASPVPAHEIYFMRYITTTIYTSWMMIVFSIPVFGAFGSVFNAGWLYLPLMFVSVICTALIASGFGMGITVFLVRFFPARQTKDIIFYLSLCFGIFIYIVFRMLKPENLVNPDQYGHFVEYLSSISQPAGPYVPASWAANLLSLYLLDREIDWLLLSLLIISVPSLFFIGEWAMRHFFLTAFSRSQESFGGFRTFTQQEKYEPGIQKWIFKKESKTFLRDSAEWSQIFMIAALVIVYLYSFKALPVERSPFKTEYITNLISFLNVGVAGFMVTSLSARFVFPAVGGETAAFWIIASSPLTMERFLWYKFVFYVLPFSVFSLFLVLCSDYLLGIKGPMWWFSILSSLLICWTVVGMAVGFGAMYADFKAENRTAALGGMGALVFLFSSMTVVFVILASAALPMYRLTKQWIRITSSEEGIWSYSLLQGQTILLLSTWLFCSLLLGFLCVRFFWKKGVAGLRR